MKRLGLAILLLLGLISVALAQVVITTPLAGPNATPLTPSTTFTTGSSSATLTGTTNKWTYICGFVLTSGGTTAAITGNVTITGLPTTMNFTYVFVSSGQGVLGVAFPGCLVASAANTNIVVNTPAGGAGTVGSISAWGFTN